MTRSRWKLAGLAALTGLLYALSFPDPGWRFLAWVALVPFFLALGQVGPLGGAGLASLAAALGTLIGCHWVVGTFVGEYGFSAFQGVLFLLGITLVASLPYALAGAVMAFLARRRLELRTAIIFALVWVAMEWLRVECFPRFPWMLLGASQARWPVVTQIADLTGVYGISFVLVLFSGLWAVAIAQQKSLRRLGICGAVAFGSLVVTLAYGAWGLGRYGHQEHSVSTIRVALVQPSIPQRHHWDPARIPGNIQRHLKLSHKALEAGPRLLVWPEAAATFDIRTDRRFLPRLLPSLATRRTYFLVGTPVVEGGRGGRKLYNSALLFNPHGRIVGRYDKRELLPFGEFYPGWVKALESLWSSLRQHMGNIEITPGKRHARMRIEGAEIGMVICHEILFPGLVRRSVGSDPGILLNISNDAWFGTSAGVRQHFELGLLRAVENRRPLVRAANSGISALVDAAGRVSTALEVESIGNLDGLVTPRSNNSFYHRFGDWFAVLCLLSVAVLLGHAVVKSMRAGIAERRVGS